MIDSSTLVSDDLTGSRLDLTLLGDLLSASSQRVWLGRIGPRGGGAIGGDLDTVALTVRLGYRCAATLSICTRTFPIRFVFGADQGSVSLGRLSTTEISNDTRLQRENTVVLEPEEHNLLEVRLCCLEETLKLVLL